jgi:hypothetical protein
MVYPLQQFPNII